MYVSSTYKTILHHNSIILGSKKFCWRLTTTDKQQKKITRNKMVFYLQTINYN